MQSRQLKAAAVVLAVVVAVVATSPANAVPQVSLVSPRVVASGVGFRLALSPVDGGTSPYTLRISMGDETVFTRSGHLPDTIENVVLPRTGKYRITVEGVGDGLERGLRVLPGFASVIPPVVAIAMALIFRQVVIALFVGVWLGAFFVNDFDPIRSFFYVIDHYVVDSLAGESGRDHVSIAVFTLLLGGMVGVFSSIGGTQGVARQISRIATNDRRGQLATWLMGIVIFFDDYTNTLIAGNTMRPITDRLKISREKLSFIVDATAAPVTVIAVVTSWAGFEISLIKDAFVEVGIDRNPFTAFVASIQYSFYPILVLLFGLMVAASLRDFGPMLSAERRSRKTGKVLSDKAVPLSSIDAEIRFDGSPHPRWYNAAIPVAVVVLGTLVGLVLTGQSALREAGNGGGSLMDAIRESNSFVALLWSSLAGCAVAILLGVVQRLATLTEALQSWVTGIRSMMLAIVILVLAWCIGAVCSDLHTPDYLVARISGFVTPGILPVIVFVIAAGISFATGTSWGTMTILTPITIPLVLQISELNALQPSIHEAVLLSSIGAILSGSVFGDHCSPISDTTIMSSMASAADHIDHVRTQLPYAVVCGLTAAFLGYLPAAFGFPAVLSIVSSALVLFGVIMLFGRKSLSNGSSSAS